MTSNVQHDFGRGAIVPSIQASSCEDRPDVLCLDLFEIYVMVITISGDVTKAIQSVNY